MTDTANGEGRNWQPLLEGETAVEALAVVHEIVEAIALQPRSQQQGLQGDASLALLLAHCRHPAAYHKLDLALSTAATASLSLSLFSGVSGLLWLLHRVGAGAEADPHRIATTMTGRTALRPPRRGLALPGKRLPHDRSRCGASVPTHSTRQIGSRSARRFAVIAVASAGGPPTPGTRQGGAIRSQ
ncbi:MAG TPA: hypothetical protein VFU71_08990, partial [Burkholderiaceae bacterium]|nr:hypothetical protein [Burkholderiaceae bacterium]